MKEDSKRIVEWLIKHLSDYKISVMRSSKLSWFEKNSECDDVSEALNFLQKLPDIERCLCNGGYIQDINGTPCRANDKVMITQGAGNDSFFAFLRWDDKEKRFFFEWSNGYKSIITSVYEFEKVKTK